MITVIDVIREMGIEPLPDLSWAVGNRVRDLYEQEKGTLPAKVLRPKTNAGGTHCFAVYPEEMRERIAAVVRQFKTESARQLSLF